ncbi:fasciclin-1 isoform X4 [Chrysoperla carnea]|uniref:fasciclin-1 isoform X4 n=1 Tax=Chrysoperla carnea TaxID=189513 RepID=UPI001D066601|nr:fasciclin-1 isoform X4 [Chrysoperla carnea]
MKCVLFSVCFNLVFLISGVHNATVDEKIREDPDLSQFYSLLEASPIANISLLHRHVTIFAPTNQAFQKYKGRTDVLYHIANQFITLDDLASKTSVSTEMEGNPPLWITIRPREYNNEIYINNARIHRGRSDYVAPNARGIKQVLHIIDEVLVPVLTTNTAAYPVSNPDAFLFLNQTDNIDVGEHRVRSYRHRVQIAQKENVFKKEGHHTYFIPVDEGFKPPTRPDKIDGKVIDGHIIPNHVLFTHASTNFLEYQTLAFGDMLEVTISFETTTEGKNERTMVKSNTLQGNSNFAAGVVLAEIVKANIPVRNGVVHLIQRPLMVVDTNVTTFLEDIEHQDGPLYKFYNLVMDFAPEFMDKLNNMRDLTLFAPSNEALNETEHLSTDRNYLREILNLHLVNDRLPLEKIEKSNIHTLFQVQTAAIGKTLYFNVVNTGTEKVLSVEGGGVNATVVQPNIAATNGIVHIIDRVLGVPYTSVLEKLRTDPMLNDTFVLGKANRFNDQLADRTKRFTYFVPRDKAWREIEIMYPSTHKKLFMKEFAYHATSILERHLVISDIPFTMKQMRLLANETNNEQIIVLPTVRDSLKIRIRDNEKSGTRAGDFHPNGSGFVIEWQNERIPVFRPDVECTNGIIHVIDRPFLKDSDIQVTGAAGSITALCILPHLIMCFIAKWLLL